MAGKPSSKGPTQRPKRPAGRPAKKSSPLSTGDYGGRFQDRVGGWLLAQLLMQQTLPGLPGQLVRVGLQRRIHDALLDDAVVSTTAGIDLQISVKVGAAVSSGDHDFSDSIILGWQAQEKGCWSGIAMPSHGDGVRALAELVFLARENDEVAEFMTRTTMPGVAGNRDRFVVVRRILDGAVGAPISDAQFHAFLRKFVLLEFDFDFPPSKDEAAIVALLESNRAITRAEAAALFDALVSIGEDLTMAAGSVSVAGLERRLRDKNIPAGLPPDLRPIETAVASYADRTFESGSATTAGVHLDRSDLVRRVETAIDGDHDVLLTGAAGYGKSTVIRAVVDDLTTTGPVLHLNGRRIERAGAWPGLASEIGVPSDRVLLKALLAMNTRGACVVIDSIEHIVSPGARDVVNDLLHDLKAAETPLRLVLGVRDTAVSSIDWLETDNVRPLKQIPVAAITRKEEAQIARVSPVLGQLLARSQRPFPGGLKLLSMLHDHRISEPALAQTSATESDLLDLWWARVLVGSDPGYIDRQRVTMMAAEAVIAEPSGYFALPMTAPAHAIEALIVDGVLLYEPNLDRYRFGHDIIQDWAIVQWLLNASGAQAERLERVLATPGYLRAVSLFAQRLAERERARYDELRALLIAKNDQRAQHAFLTALVLSPHADRLLREHATELLANNGALLERLLHLVEVEQIHLNFEMVDAVRRGGYSTADATMFAAGQSMPRVPVWSSMIAFCLERASGIGQAAFAFLRVAKRWQESTLPGWSHRREILDYAFDALGSLEHWRPRPDEKIGLLISYDDEPMAEKMARAIVGLSVDVDPDRVAGYLRDLVATGYGDDQDDMMQWLPHISTVLTDEVVDFATSVLIAPDPEPWAADMAEMGLENNFDYFPASDAQGPFLSLLRANETAGLELARRLLQRATDKFAQRIAQDFGVRQRDVNFDFNGREITMRGDGRSYAWYRPKAWDSSVATSMLMAVETWALEEIAKGRDPREIADLILADGATLPFLGVVVNIAYDHPLLFTALADVAARPWFLRLEMARAALDEQPDFEEMSAMLPPEMRMPSHKGYIREHNKARDGDRCQYRYPGEIIANALFSAGDDVRTAFLARVAQMTIVDATWYVEEAELAHANPDDQTVTSSRNTFELFSFVTNPDHWIIDGDEKRLRQKPVSKANQKETLRSLLIGTFAEKNIIANSCLVDYRAPADPISFATVADEAATVSEKFDLGDDGLVQAQIVALRLSCVAVTFAPDVGAVAPPTAFERVLDAARTYDRTDWDAHKEDVDAMDIRANIATALGALFAADPTNDEVRGLVFRLARRAELLDVLRGLNRGLIPLWRTRASAPVGVFSIMLEAIAELEGKRTLNDAKVAEAEQLERGGDVRPWPAMPAPSQPLIHRLGHIVGNGMPRRITDPVAIAALKPLIIRLLDIAAQADDRGPWLSFNSALGRLAASVAVVPGDGSDAYLARISDWQQTPEFYRELVAELARSHHADDEIDEMQLRFIELGRPFLAADHGAAFIQAHLRDHLRDISWALIMVQGIEGVMVPEGWPHAARFGEHIDRWVDAVGGHPMTAEALLAFVERFYGAFTAGRTVRWLDRIIATIAQKQLPELWRKTGRSMATVLFKLLTERPGEMSEPQAHISAVGIAEQLLGAGVNGSGELRKALDDIYKH